MNKEYFKDEFVEWWDLVPISDRNSRIRAWSDLSEYTDYKNKQSGTY